MKRLFLVVAVLAILISSVFASQVDPRVPLSLIDGSTKPVVRDSRFVPAFSFAIEPVSIVENYYDYFPGSYTGKPLQRAQTDFLDGHWFAFHTKTGPSETRRVFKTFIDNTGNIISNAAFGSTDLGEGYPGLAVTEGGRPLLAYHVNLDTDGTLEIAFGYDAVIGGSATDMNSDAFNIVDNPTNIEVDGTVYDQNEFIWPSVQVGPSPVAGSQRVYVLGKNATEVGAAISENVLLAYKDFTEFDIENQNFDGSGWSMRSIPQMDAWNTSMGEWRRPYMSFIVHEDKVYYIGYHIAYTEPEGSPLDEGTITAFVADNYGEGTWEQYSTFGDFDSTNGPFIDPNTGDYLASGASYFSDYTSDQLSNSIGQSGHFSTGIDTAGRIHFPLFYTQSSNEGTYYPALHTVKSVSFDTNNNEWYVREIYPQQENGSDPFIPNDPINITQYDSTDLFPMEDVWMWWDQDGDGLYDEVLDDGTWDGVDDGVTAADTDYWGMPVLATIWPYMYWNTEAADNAMMFHLHTAHITNANDHGMMAMAWQESERSRLANEYPDDYPEYAPYQNMTDIAISVSADNGDHWSEPIFLNGIDNPEMGGDIPEFPYLGSEIDYIGVDGEGNQIGRVHIAYLADETFGSSVQGIGQADGGEMKYMALDVVFTNAPTDNTDNDVVPSVAMLTQNYPNPFNPTTTINYNVAKSGDVTLNVYNVKGQLVKTLVNSNQNVGSHSVVWNGDDNAGNNVSSGIYFYKIDNAGRSETRKMVLVK